MQRCILLLVTVLTLGAVEFTPGAHKRLPCDGAPQLTWDVFIPKVYTEQLQATFPIVFISSPGGNPGFWGYESWAERQGVLIVGINDSKNGEWAPIHAAQSAVLATVKSKLRVHRLLRFATGFSGGAWASAELAQKCGDEFGGILFQINSQRTTPVRKHICCAYLAGVKDTTYPIENVRRDHEAARGAGNPVRYKDYADKGHDGMPREDQIAMLDWMLEYQRYGNPKMNAEEQKAAQAGLIERMAKLATVESPSEREAQSDALLQSPVVAKGKQGAELPRLWCSAALALADAETDLVQRYRRLETVSGSDRSAALPAPDRKSVSTKMADLRKDKTVKADLDSRNALAGAQAAEAKAGHTKGKLQEVLNAYQAILKRWPDTLAAKDATTSVKRVQALLQ